MDGRIEDCALITQAAACNRSRDLRNLNRSHMPIQSGTLTLQPSLSCSNQRIQLQVMKMQTTLFSALLKLSNAYLLESYSSWPRLSPPAMAIVFACDAVHIEKVQEGRKEVWM